MLLNKSLEEALSGAGDAGLPPNLEDSIAFKQRMDRRLRWCMAGLTVAVLLLAAVALYLASQAAPRC